MDVDVSCDVDRMTSQRLSYIITMTMGSCMSLRLQMKSPIVEYFFCFGASEDYTNCAQTGQAEFKCQLCFFMFSLEVAGKQARKKRSGI